MHRFFVSPEGCRGPEIALGEGDSRHAAKVLRLTAGEPVEVLDGRGTVHAGRLVRVDRQGVVVGVEQRRSVPCPPPVVLASALLKGRAMDFLVQKATELGVSAILPLAAERSVARVEAKEVGAKIEGWLATAVEACKQCGNPWLPRFEAPVSPERYAKAGLRGLHLLAALAGEPKYPGEVLRSRGSEPGPVTIWIGPEGDFTLGELDALVAAGAVPVTLGPLVLRGETAAVAALAIVQHELRMRTTAAG